MNININLGTRLSFAKINAKGEVTWRGESQNLITDLALAGLFGEFSSGPFANGMCLSTSTSAGTTADTTIGGTVATSVGSSSLFPPQVREVSPTGLISEKWGVKFNSPGTWGSVGICASDGSDLRTKALIRDLSNNPTTVTLLPGEELDVQYTLLVQIPTALVTGNVGGITYEHKCYRGTGVFGTNHPSCWFGGGSPIEPANAWSIVGSDTPALGSLATLAPDYAAGQTPPGWEAFDYGGAPVGGGSWAALGASTGTGNTRSRTYRLSTAANVPLGGAVRGINIHIKGLGYNLATRFTGTLPSKTDTQEFRFDVTISVTR